MIFTLLCATVLAADVADAGALQKPISLALPGLNGVNLAPGEIELHAESLAQKLIAHRASVLTARDLQTALGIERQKELLGCSENNCVVELTGALGVEGVIIGDLGRLEGSYVLNLKVLSPANARPLALHNARCKPADLDRMFENAVRALLRSLAFSMHREDLAAADLSPIPDPVEVVVKPPPPPPDRRPWALLPAAIGAGALGTGAVLQVVAGQKYGALLTGGLPEPGARALRDEGRGLEAAGNVTLVIGGVALAAAAVVYFTGAPITPTVSVTNDQASIGVAGVLP